MIDVDLEEGTFEIQGKGAKGRRIAIHEELAEDLEAWLDSRGRRNGPLFCQYRSIRRMEMEPMTTRAVYALVQKRAAAAELSRVAPHDLRRTFVTRLLELGVDPVTVKDAAGHESIDTTARYDLRGWERCREAVGRL